MPRRILAATLAAALLLATAACGDDGGGTADPQELEGVTVTGEFGEEPEVTTTEAFEAEEATSAEVVAGDGEELAEDSVVLAKVAVFNRDGKLVQGNYESDAKERIDLGADQAPWLGELVGAHIGSRVAVALPVTEVTGPQGAPEAGLEAGDPMLFLVDVLEEAEAPLEGPEGESVDPPADAPKPVVEGDKITSIDFAGTPANPPTKLQVIPLIEGDGPKVEQGQQVMVDYHGVVWGADKAFDSSFERGEPAAFPLSEGGLIKGWVQGLAGVAVGSRVMLVIPPELGYGKQGSGADIPPDSTLVFVIDVLAAY